MRARVALKALETRFIGTRDQLAYIFNKALPLDVFRMLRCNLNVVSIEAEIEGAAKS